MAKDRNVKLTLADLIAKKEAKEAAKNRTQEVYIESLDGCITIHAPSLSTIFKAMDMINDSAEASMYSNAYLIYHSVKEFQNPELLQAYEVKDNIDIVFALLTPLEIGEVATKVMQLAGFAKPEEVDKKIKN